MAEKGHWYTDKNGNHYFVKEGQSPKEGWEESKRRKMISGGKYWTDEGDGKGRKEVSREDWEKYEADEDFDLTGDDDFGFDEEENDTDLYSQPAYGDEEGHDYELDVLREREERGLDNDDEDFDEEEYDFEDEVSEILERLKNESGQYYDARSFAEQKLKDYDPKAKEEALKRFRELGKKPQDEQSRDGTNGWKPSEESTPAYEVGGFYSINEGDEWDFVDGGYVKVEKVNGDEVTIRTPGGNRETITKDELSDRVKHAYKIPGGVEGSGKNASGKTMPQLDGSDNRGPYTANIDANVDAIAKEVSSKFGEANVNVDEKGHILLKNPEGFDPVAIANEDEIPTGAIVKIMPNWLDANENPDSTYFVKEDRGDRLLLWSPSKSSSFGGYTYEWPKKTMYVPPRMGGGNLKASDDSVRIPDKIDGSKIKEAEGKMSYNDKMTYNSLEGEEKENYAKGILERDEIYKDTNAYRGDKNGLVNHIDSIAKKNGGKIVATEDLGKNGINICVSGKEGNNWFRFSETAPNQWTTDTKLAKYLQETNSTKNKGPVGKQGSVERQKPKGAPAGPGEPPDKKYVRYPNKWINWNDEWYENEDQLAEYAGEGARNQVRDATDDEVSKNKEYRYRELRTMANPKTKMKDFVKHLTGYDIDDEELFILYDFMKRMK